MLDLTPLLWAASTDSALSGVNGPSTIAPVMTPCAAMSFSASASVVEGNAGEAPSSDAESRRQVNGVLHDIALGCERRIDIELRVREQQAPIQARQIEEKSVREAHFGAQARVGRRHRRQ